MAEPTIQKIVLNGIEPVYEPLDSSTYVLNLYGTLFLHIKNTNVAQIVISIASHPDCNYGFHHAHTVVIPGSGQRMIGPFSPARFNAQVGDARDNKLSILWVGSNGGTVTVAALEVGP